MENEPQSRTARREAERMASGHKRKFVVPVVQSAQGMVGNLN